MYFSQKNQKWIESFLHDGFLLKSWPYPRSDQTKPAQVVYYILLDIVWETTTKNFRSQGPMGAEIIGQEAGMDFFTKLSLAPKQSSFTVNPFNHLWDGLGQCV